MVVENEASHSGEDHSKAAGAGKLWIVPLEGLKAACGVVKGWEYVLNDIQGKLSKISGSTLRLDDFRDIAGTEGAQLETL